MSDASAFPYLTLSQVVETQNLLDGLTEVPVINGITVDGARQFAARLIAMAEVAEELADVADRAGFPLNSEVRQQYGSVARIYIQGPGAAQVRLDVSKKISIVEYEDDDQLLDILDGNDEGTEVTVGFDPEFDLGEAEADVIDLFGEEGPRPEVTD